MKSIPVQLVSALPFSSVSLPAPKEDLEKLSVKSTRKNDRKKKKKKETTQPV